MTRRTRSPYLTSSTGTAQPVRTSTRAITSGTSASALPSSTAATNSLRASIRTRRPASAPVPSRSTRVASSSVRRTDDTLPVRTGGGPSPRPTATARVTEPATACRAACPAVSGYSDDAACPPNVATTARASSSSQGPSTWSRTTVRPYSSASTVGPGRSPASSRTFWSMRGNARPMASASSSGNPSRAAHATAVQPLSPPISEMRTAATGTPCSASTRSRIRPGSARLPMRSSATAGEPIRPTGMTNASSGSSPAVTTCTGPHSSMACSATGHVTAAGPPPPPEPRTAQPRAKSASTPASICIRLRLRARTRPPMGCEPRPWHHDVPPAQ